jgi:hypothetical protein
MTHQLTDSNGNHVVRERYWLTYQPGEIRTCTSCHGINTSDQAGHLAPTNESSALRDLLRYWKQQTGYSRILSVQQSNSIINLRISGAPNRTNVIESTTDFNNWQPVGTNSTSTDGLFWFDDVNGILFPQRFYRVKVP